MTKSISGSQVRLIASTNAIFGADSASALFVIGAPCSWAVGHGLRNLFPCRYLFVERCVCKLLHKVYCLKCVELVPGGAKAFSDILRVDESAYVHLTFLSPDPGSWIVRIISVEVG